MISPFLLIPLAFILTLAFIPPARRVALRCGFVDRPGGRKRHDKAVPPIGGLIVFPVFLACSAPMVQDWQHTLWFYAASALILTVGAFDDRFTVPPLVKFAAQFIAAWLIVVPGQAQVASLGNLFGQGPVGLGFVSVPFSIIATVLLINAVNLMDGLDGLAGGLGVIVLSGMALCVYDPAHNATSMVALCAALVGFLVYNMRNPWRRKACLFMGDAGSLTLGLAISWYAITLAGARDSHLEPVIVAWLLGLPIMDTCGQFARRIAEGRHPFSADQDHFHHHFVRVGLSPGRATAAVLTVEAVYGLIGMIGFNAGVPPQILLILWGALLFIHIALSMRPRRFRRLIAFLLRRGPVGA